LRFDGPGEAEGARALLIDPHAGQHVGLALGEQTARLAWVAGDDEAQMVPRPRGHLPQHLHGKTRGRAALVLVVKWGQARWHDGRQRIARGRGGLRQGGLGQGGQQQNKAQRARQPAQAETAPGPPPLASAQDGQAFSHRAPSLRT